jgi:hypothetical protein
VLKPPLRYVIYSLLREHKVITDRELLQKLKRQYGDVAERDLNKELLAFEINGLIRVSWISKEERRIEFVEEIEAHEA